MSICSCVFIYLYVYVGNLYNYVAVRDTTRDTGDNVQITSARQRKETERNAKSEKWKMENGKVKCMGRPATGRGWWVVVGFRKYVSIRL